MAFKGLLKRDQKFRFKCIHTECGNLCCKNNLVVLNSDDIKTFKNLGIDIDDVTETMRLNDFIGILNTSPIKQLEDLYVLKLKTRKGGSCVFLNETDGLCKIYENRPYYCREYPFKFFGREIKIITDCPGHGRGAEKSVSELREELGLSEMGLKPPFLVGDESKLRVSRPLMSAGYRILKLIK